MLATSEVLANFGVTCSPAILNNLEEVKIQDAEKENIISIAEDARKSGIIILEDYLLEAPESKFPYIEMFLEANLFAFSWDFYNEQMRKKAGEEEEVEELEKETRGSKRAYTISKRTRKQDFSQFELPWDEKLCSSACTTSSRASPPKWREVF